MAATLPVELHFAIIDEVARPHYPRAYRLQPGSSRTLAQLCLVDRAYCAYAEPLLYSRAFITPKSLHSFARTTVGPIHGTESGYATTTKGRLVRSLAFYNFEDEPTLGTLQSMGKILYALQDTLERLFLDVFLRQIDYNGPLLGHEDPNISLRWALRSLTNISEFCLMRHLPWSLDPMPWKSQVKIKRIASFQPNLHFQFTDTLASMPFLETFVGAFPKLATETRGTPLESIFETVKENFKEIIIVVPTTSEPGLYVTGFRKFMDEVMDSHTAKEQGEKRKMLSIAEISRGEESGSETIRWGLNDLSFDSRWFGKAVADGDIWNVPRTSWDVHRSGGQT